MGTPAQHNCQPFPCKQKSPGQFLLQKIKSTQRSQADHKRTVQIHPQHGISQRKLCKQMACQVGQVSDIDPHTVQFPKPAETGQVIAGITDINALGNMPQRQEKQNNRT